MQLFGIPLKLEVSIKGLPGGGFLCATGYCWFFQLGDMVRHRRVLLVSFISDCFMEEAYEGGLDEIFNYGSSRRPQGLSGVGIVCISENILELYALYLVASLGGSKIGMESSAAKNLLS